MPKSTAKIFFGLAFSIVPLLHTAYAETVEQKEKSPMGSYTKPSEEELRRRLTAEEYHVTQCGGTERPFENAFWDNKRAGIYVDIVTGEPLFSSLDKYDSGTGWPSFTKPLVAENITYRTDRRLLPHVRTEVRSKHGDTHLGHVFDDGPGPTGKRYCINSAALRFIPVEALETAGYGEFLPLFGRSKASNPSAIEPVKEERAVLAGGCFWGMEEILRSIPGVRKTEVGYTGGKIPHPTYEIVSSGTSGHAEAVEVIFDPSKLSYEALLGYFFRMHDPTTLNRQGNDRGTQYRSAIFTTSPEQWETAHRVKAEVERSGKWKRPIVTEITTLDTFYPAEEYHQDYLKKHPGGYTCHYLREEPPF